MNKMLRVFSDFRPPPQNAADATLLIQLLGIRMQSPEEHDSFIIKHWQGKAPLWSAYWLISWAGRGCILMLNSTIYSMLKQGGPPSKNLVISAVTFGNLLHAAYFTFAFICVARCSKNVKNPIWGSIAVAAMAVAASIFLYGILGFYRDLLN